MKGFLKEAMQWLPVKLAIAALIELCAISFVLDIWSVIIR